MRGIGFFGLNRKSISEPEWIYGLEFDGTDDSMLLSNSYNWNTANDYIEFKFFYPSQSAGWKCLITTPSAPTLGRILISDIQDSSQIWIGGSGGNTAFTLEKWDIVNKYVTLKIVYTGVAPGDSRVDFEYYLNDEFLTSKNQNSYGSLLTDVRRVGYENNRFYFRGVITQIDINGNLINYENNWDGAEINGAQLVRSVDGINWEIVEEETLRIFVMDPNGYNDPQNESCQVGLFGVYNEDYSSYLEEGVYFYHNGENPEPRIGDSIFVDENGEELFIGDGLWYYMDFTCWNVFPYNTNDCIDYYAAIQIVNGVVINSVECQY
jgi:hypothetical protein